MAATLALLLLACGGGGGTTAPLLCGGLVVPVSKPVGVGAAPGPPGPRPVVRDAPRFTVPATPSPPPPPPGAGAPGDLCPTLTGTGTADGLSFTVSGTVTYEDKVFDRLGFTGATVAVPARQAVVQVVRCSDGTVLASGVTDNAGAYGVTTGNPSPNPAGVYVRALTRVTDPNHALDVKDTAGATYAVRSNGFDETGGGGFSQDLLAGATGFGAPFNILDVVLAGIEYVDASVPLTAPLPALSLEWEADVTDLTAYFPSTRTIRILDQPDAVFPDTDGYDDIVILHELGHYIADQLSEDDSPGGIHSLGDDTQDARLAWSEGWGDFFAGAAYGSPDYVDTYNPAGASGLYFSLETGSTSIVGTTSELAVAAALWDAIDSPGSDDDNDPSGLGDAVVLATFEDLAGVTAPVTFGQFWNRMRLDPGRTSVELDQFQAAALGNGIDLAADATGNDPDGNDATPGSATLSVGIPVAANLAYFVDTPKTADVDHFKVSLIGGVPYTACTFNLSDGADTAIDVLRDDGTPLGLTNDNWDGEAYSPTCGTFQACPPNDATRLASSIDFTPADNGDYLVRVRRSGAAPPSTDLFGGYVVLVAEP